MSKKRFPVTCQRVRFSVFFPYKGNDKYQFAASTLERLVNLIIHTTKTKVRGVEESETEAYIEIC